MGAGTAARAGGAEQVVVDASAGVPHVNEVRLVGRVASEATEKVLPSGDVVVSARLVVRRASGAGGARPSRQTVDTLDCAAWGGRPRRSLVGWRVDDVVEVVGAVRRRFFRAGGDAASRVEIEVSSAKVIRRGASG